MRRVLASEKVEIFVSGSSAKMLSREVAHHCVGARQRQSSPFSYREYLRHRGFEPPEGPAFAPKARRSKLEKILREYLTSGGFPEAQGLQARDRIPLPQSDVAAVFFRVSSNVMESPA